MTTDRIAELELPDEPDSAPCYEESSRINTEWVEYTDKLRAAAVALKVENGSLSSELNAARLAQTSAEDSEAHWEKCLRIEQGEHAGALAARDKAEAALATARQQERERCLDICYEFLNQYDNPTEVVMERIRALGEQES